MKFMGNSDQKISWKIAGRAGEGIDVTGAMFGKLCLRHGMNIFSYREYPSLIRGGHNTHQVHASFAPVTSQQKRIDLLIALNEEGISFHQDELGPGSVVFCEAAQDKYDTSKYAATGATFYDVPMTNMSREETGHFLSQNVVCLGASAWVLGLSLDILKEVVADQFKNKSEEVIQKNHKAMQRGYDYAKEHCPPIREAYPTQSKPQILVTGNQAVALGAIAGGVQFFAGYPMTPTSDVLHTLAAHQTSFPLVVKHVEDEIAAINEVVGASYAGARAMTATATGGYALMVEGTSLAAIAETPLVICVGQRPGPATGLPSWSCQSDLQFIIRAGHGEIPKVVFTPGNVKEHFELTRHAFYLAEKYHMIVYILSDKYALESYASMPKPDEVYQNQRYSMVTEELPADNSYRRFAVTQEGYSPRSIPGQPHGLGVTNSYEHDEFGYATEDAEMTRIMNEKRQRKMAGVKAEIPPVEIIGPATADVTFVSWGSTRLVLEDLIRQQHVQPGTWTANLIHIPCAWPFPVDSFFKAAKDAKRLIMVEGNVTGQMEQLIRQETGIQFHDRIHRFDGRPFYAEEINEQVRKMLQ
jgi:2-oxoglutarate/2-oxoacid ferredoxin oxidoreductase subunit alpha